MHLNGKIVKMTFEGKQLEENWQIDFIVLKIFGPQELVSPHRGAVYTYITIIFKEPLL